MDILEGIKTRRSVRQFSTKRVDKDAIHTMVEAGFCAPSARNLRPRHFLVVEDPKKLETLSTLAPNFQRFTAGRLVLVVAGDTGIQPKSEFLIEDCAAAVQNILLAAHALGLGAVWCGVGMNSPGQQGLASELNMPTGLLPLAVVVVGHPAERPEPVSRWEEEKVHWEEW